MASMTQPSLQLPEWGLLVGVDGGPMSQKAPLVDDLGRPGAWSESGKRSLRPRSMRPAALFPVAMVVRAILL